MTNMELKKLVLELLDTLIELSSSNDWNRFRINEKLTEIRRSVDNG